jgi:hypothetical protein
MPRRSAKRTKCIPRVAFVGLVKEITKTNHPGVKWSKLALNGLHEEVEQYLSERFSQARGLAERFGHRMVSLKHFSDKPCDKSSSDEDEDEKDDE